MTASACEELVTAPVEEAECCWGPCPRVAVYRAVFSHPCVHPSLVCIGHRDKATALQGGGANGWVCHVCKARIGRIVNWEHAR
jgi:hypothetical protein